MYQRRQYPGELAGEGTGRDAVKGVSSPGRKGVTGGKVGAFSRRSFGRRGTPVRHVVVEN